MKKKVIAMLLLTAMLLALLCGCGAPAAEEKPASAPEKTQDAPAAPAEEKVEKEDPDNGEQYDVHIIYRIAPQNEEATQAVVDYINTEILPDLIPNTTISIEFIAADEYIQTYKLKCASGEKMDLVLSMASFGFADFAAQGAFLSWNDYLDYMPNTMKVIPDGWLAATTIDGECYGIPNYQITARSHSLSVDNAMCEKYGIDASAIMTEEDLAEKYMAVLAEAGEYAEGSIIDAENNFVWSNSQANVFDWMGLEQVSGFIVVENDNPSVIKNMFEVESVRNNYATLREWADKGYYNPEKIDGLNNSTLWQENRYGCRFDGWQPYWAESIKSNWNREMTVNQISAPVVTTASVRSTMTALACTSENPSRAAKVFDLINSNEELFNAICYGIEGVNYTFNDDGTVNMIAEPGYAIASWSYQLGNTMLQYRMPGKPEDYNSLVDNTNRSAKLSALFGFSFNAENVQTEIASCNAVIDAYRQGFLRAKYEDVDAALAELNNQLYDAGLQTVIDEAQAQLDAWYAAK